MTTTISFCAPDSHSWPSYMYEVPGMCATVKRCALDFPSYSFPCYKGSGMCVSSKYWRVIISDRNVMQLHFYSISDGSLVGSFGSRGGGKDQFNFSQGGLCISPDGESVLLADMFNSRIQVIRVADGSWSKSLGEGVLRWTRFVDCNADVIAVFETGARISLLSWYHGDPIARINLSVNEFRYMDECHNIRLLANGKEVAVANNHNAQVSVFSLSGEFVKTRCMIRGPFLDPRDFVEVVNTGDFIVIDYIKSSLITISHDDTVLSEHFNLDGDQGKFKEIRALATLPDGGLIVQDLGGTRLNVFRGMDLRFAWLEACARIAATRHTASTKRVKV